jgi:hypothetical protein
MTTHAVILDGIATHTGDSTQQSNDRADSMNENNDNGDTMQNKSGSRDPMQNNSGSCDPMQKNSVSCDPMKSNSARHKGFDYQNPLGFHLSRMNGLVSSVLSYIHVHQYFSPVNYTHEYYLRLSLPMTQNSLAVYYVLNCTRVHFHFVSLVDRD